MPTATRAVVVEAPPRLPTGNDTTDRAFDGVRLSFDKLAQALGWCRITDVSLANGATTRVRHNLGRVPAMRPLVSAPAYNASMTTGRVEVVSMDAAEVQLRATGFTVAITVDVLVF